MQTKRHYKKILAKWEDKWGMEFHPKSAVSRAPDHTPPSDMPIS